MRILLHAPDRFELRRPTGYMPYREPIALLGMVAELGLECLHHVPLRSICDFCHQMGMTCERPDCAWCV